MSEGLRKYNTTGGKYYGAALDDRIIEALLDPKKYPMEEGSPEHEAFIRISAADDLVKKWGNKKAVQMHANAQGISTSLAIADINSASYIFGSAFSINKKVAISHIIDKCREAYQAALDLGDMLAAAKFLEIEKKAVSELPDTKENENRPVITMPVLTAMPREIEDQEGVVIDLDEFKKNIYLPKDEFKAH